MPRIKSFSFSTIAAVCCLVFNLHMENRRWAMDISKCRFVHKRIANPPDLYSSSQVSLKNMPFLKLISSHLQTVLLRLLCGVSWRSVGRVRSWALASLPASIREGLLLEIFRRWEHRGQDRKKVVQKLWSALSTINICNFEIPPWIGEKGIWDLFSSKV